MTESPDTFTAVAGLIALVTDAKACSKRLDELRKLGAELAEAQAKLDADRETHAASAAALEARETALAPREEACAQAEAEYFQQQPRERFPASPNLDPGGRSHSGLTREAYRS
jgi:peptidoglycan hydrolase CwlO-like protein